MHDAETPQPITLLADRLRVEERLLIAAFAARGHVARLVAPATLRVPLASPAGWAPPLVVDRGVATVERAALAALLAAGGAIVINRAATARLLADRLALARHLLVAGIAVPATVVTFDAEATLVAIDELGYPVTLQSLVVDPARPDALVTDRDAAEALVEHRAVLGGERATIVQRALPTPGHTALVVVAGSTIVTVAKRLPVEGARIEPYDDAPNALRELGERVIARLGGGVYAIDVVEGAGEPVAIGASALVNFRALQAAGVDVAGAIADFALAELAGRYPAQHERDQD